MISATLEEIISKQIHFALGFRLFFSFPSEGGQTVGDSRGVFPL
jgi:hypothetical protein